MSAMDANRSSRIAVKSAFYSLLQFCPDIARNEQVNIGILLEAPQQEYTIAKYLRHMDKTVKCLDPRVDVSLVRTMARELEERFRTKEPEVGLDNEPLFPEAKEPKRLAALEKSFNGRTRSLWRITTPRPLFLPAWQRYEDRLHFLYNRLVARHDEEKRDTRDKAYVRHQTVRALEEHQIILDLDPAPVPGSFYKENEFDAAYQLGASNYLQFFSFDVENPDIGQLKAFLASVEDVRASQALNPDRQRYYIAVIQPPRQKRHDDSQETFTNALGYLLQRDVATFEAENREHMGVIAHAMKAGENPYHYQRPLN